MSSREYQGNIWTGNSAFLCFPSQKITEINSTMLADSAEALSCFVSLSSCNARVEKYINWHLWNHDCLVTVEEAFGPNEIEHDAGEEELNETELRREPENLSGTQTWSRQIRTACWEKRHQHSPQMGHRALISFSEKKLNQQPEINSTEISLLLEWCWCGTIKLKENIISYTFLGFCSTRVKGFLWWTEQGQTNKHQLSGSICNKAMGLQSH